MIYLLSLDIFSNYHSLDACHIVDKDICLPYCQCFILQKHALVYTVSSLLATLLRLTILFLAGKRKRKEDGNGIGRQSTTLNPQIHLNSLYEKNWREKDWPLISLSYNQNYLFHVFTSKLRFWGF